MTFLRLVLQPRAVAVGLIRVPQAVEDQNLHVRVRVLSHILRDIDDDHGVQREEKDLPPSGLGIDVAMANANGRGDDKVTMSKQQVNGGQ